MECCSDETLFVFFAAPPFVDVRLGEAAADGGAGGSALPRACGAGVSESAAISSAIVLADVRGTAAARGTSTKSVVSERGEWRGGEVERRAEEERDQTISSSSEGESLAHLELEEVRESTSSEDESEAVMCGDGGKEKRVFI